MYNILSLRYKKRKKWRARYMYLLFFENYFLKTYELFETIIIEIKKNSWKSHNFCKSFAYLEES